MAQVKFKGLASHVQATVKGEVAWSVITDYATSPITWFMLDCLKTICFRENQSGWTRRGEGREREGGGGTGQCGRALSATRLMHTCTNSNITRLGHVLGGKGQVMFVTWPGDHWVRTFSHLTRRVKRWMREVQWRKVRNQPRRRMKVQMRIRRWRLR